MTIPSSDVEFSLIATIFTINYWVVDFWNTLCMDTRFMHRN